MWQGAGTLLSGNVSGLSVLHVSHGPLVGLLLPGSAARRSWALPCLGNPPAKGLLGRKNEMLKRKWASFAAAEVLKGPLCLIKVLKNCKSELVPESSDVSGLYNTTAFICEEGMADVRCYSLCLPCQFC